MRTIRLMADYSGHPLWGTDPGNIGDIAPESLPITREMVEALERWGGRFKATLDREKGAESGFSSGEAEADFVADGLALAKRLQKELGESWTVVYFDAVAQADTAVE